MYNGYSFMESARSYLDQSIDQSAIDEVRATREEQLVAPNYDKPSSSDLMPDMIGMDLKPTVSVNITPAAGVILSSGSKSLRKSNESEKPDLMRLGDVKPTRNEEYDKETDKASDADRP